MNANSTEATAICSFLIAYYVIFIASHFPVFFFSSSLSFNSHSRHIDQKYEVAKKREKKNISFHSSDFKQLQEKSSRIIIITLFSIFQVFFYIFDDNSHEREEKKNKLSDALFVERTLFI